MCCPGGEGWWREEGGEIGDRYELDAEISAHYGEGAERERLLRDAAGRLEYLRTRELLARHLPPAPATVLDVGGGTGAYALPLAAEGYSVYLVDPVPLHVEQAVSAPQPGAPLAGAEVGTPGLCGGRTRAWTRCCCWDRSTT